jgi:hypothetical protein
MGTAEITGLAKAFQDYGSWVLVVLLGLAVIALWKRGNSVQDARLSDAEKHRVELTALLTKSIENDKDQTHALLSLTDVIKGRANV